MQVWVKTKGLERRSVNPQELKDRAERMLVAMKLNRGELSVLLCDDRTIRRLNRQYRKLDRATDVLAFAMGEGEGAVQPNLLGDVVISLDTARRQARRNDRPILAEVTHLLAHGLLHLLGYDHPTEAKARQMNALADGLMAAARVKPGRKGPVRKTR